MSETEEQQFMAAYEANSDALFRHILFRIGGERDKAKDLLQETFTRTWSTIAGGKNIEDLRAYFYKVAHNLIIDEYRLHKAVSLDELVDKEDSDFDVKDEKTLDPSLGAEVQELLRAMDKISEDYRDLLVMRFIDGYGPEEIGKLLNQSANTVSVRINRATEKLRQVLGVNQEIIKPAKSI